MSKPVYFKFYRITNKEGLLTLKEELADSLFSLPEDEKLKRENLFATEIDDTVYYFTAERPTKENDLVLVYDKSDDEFKFLKNCDIKDTYLIIGTALKKMISLY